MTCCSKQRPKDAMFTKNVQSSNMKRLSYPAGPFRGLLFTLTLLVAAMVLETCATNPVTGKREFSLISENQEIQMGQQYDPSIVAQFGIYEDADLQQFVERIGKEMAANSERPELPWEFKVLDSPVVNAFAVPGGFVYFTRGILAHFNNEAQLAGVMGHEIGHVTARHSVQQQSKATLAQLGVVAGMIAIPGMAQYGDMASQGLQLLFLKFSRDAEEQSDKLGVRYSTSIGYDAGEMAEFFNTLDRLSGQPEDRIPTFLSTHPDPANREERVKSLAREFQQTSGRTSFEVDRDNYLRLIDGMVYGEDPRQGYLENNVFYHPELRFQFPVPSNWSYSNTPQQVQMAPKNGKAVMLLRLAEGNSLEAAAQQTVQQSNMQVVSSNNTRVNGLPALVMIADVQSQAQGQQPQVIRTMQTFIEYGGNIYHFIGMALQNDFNTYQRTFESTMSNFDNLTDPDKINRKPERIDIVEVDRTGSLQNALQRAGMASDRLQDLAVLNGMDLQTQVSAGTLIKVVRR